MANGALPGQAQVVIIGGGVIGCAVAYHLTRLGWRDIVLLEQGRLTSGTTWHAAGLVGQLRAHPNLTRLMQESISLYARLEAETGQATGWKQCGSILVARTAARLALLKRIASSARLQKVDCEQWSPQMVRAHYPLARTDDLLGALWLPGDGKVNPTDLTQALAKGARMGGARIFERTRVTAVSTRDGRVTGVSAGEHEIAAEYVVNCAGQWARQVGALCGVTVPLHAAEHMYVVTDRIAGVTGDLPVLRDPDGCIYAKEEVGGLLIGGFEPNAKPWGMTGIPDGFEFGILPDDWDQFSILMENAIQRLPALETAPIKTFMNGPESFTPDNTFILGEAPELKNFFVAAGFNSMGIASAGGAGRALAEWIVTGAPTRDLWNVDIRRFGRFHGNPRWLHDRVKEAVGLHYAMPWPNREMQSGRPLRRSPLHDRLAAKHAIFGTTMGWERPNVFAPSASEARLDYSFERENWFPYAAIEHRAARTAAAMFDLSSSAKYFLQGRDAEAVLQHLCANDVALKVGTTTSSAMLNARGGYESCPTVARLAPDRFLLVTGAAQAVRDAAWIRRHIPDCAHATLTDVTSAYAVIALVGPRSQDVMASLTSTSLHTEAFPVGAIREIALAYGTVLARHGTWGGEAAWELYIPTEFAVGLYDALTETGHGMGLRHAGHYAYESLRLEQGSPAWGRDLSIDVDPFQAGLGVAVNFDKGDFIGRDALVRRRDEPPRSRLVSLVATAAETPLAHGGETILIDGEPAGRVTSAAFGHTVGAVVALGHVATGDGHINDHWLSSRRFAIDIGGEQVPVRARLSAAHHPKSGGH